MAKHRLLALIGAALLASSCVDTETAAPGQSSVKLPSTYPEHLAVADDGSLWMTGSYGGVTRLDARGNTTQYETNSDDFAADIVQGPDGAMWFAGIETVGRIDKTGHVKNWPAGGFGMAYSLAATRDALWFTNDTPAIERISQDGSIRTFTFRGPRESFGMAGITAGPDGALWFTEHGYGAGRPGWIGRMTTDGRYSRWPLRRHPATPVRIAAGKDGALWFTEQDGHAIGRITTSGAEYAACVACATSRFSCRSTASTTTPSNALSQPSNTHGPLPAPCASTSDTAGSEFRGTRGTVASRRWRA